jgi:sec-independent protein translocase protein TatA
VEALTPWHLAVILLGFLVLFGHKKLPEASRSLGRSLRIFRTELHAMNEGKTPDHVVAATGPATVPPSAIAAWEAEAAAAEARAAELRARARADGTPRRTDS